MTQEQTIESIKVLDRLLLNQNIGQKQEKLILLTLEELIIKLSKS